MGDDDSSSAQECDKVWLGIGVIVMFFYHIKKLFQQININGKETTGLSSNAFRPIAKEMLQAIEMRQRYIKSSNQVFSPTADRHVRLARGKTKSPKPEEMVSFYASAYLWLFKLTNSMVIQNLPVFKVYTNLEIFHIFGMICKD